MNKSQENTEKTIDSMTSFALEMMERGVPPQEVLDAVKFRLFRFADKNDDQVTIAVFSVMLTQAIYHLANMKTFTKN
jgi:hypothetical protein